MTRITQSITTTAATLLLTGAALAQQPYDFAWTQITTPGPTQRFDHRMVYDPAAEEVVLFGGTEGHVGGFNPATPWVFDGTDWTLAPIFGVGPAGRRLHGLACDTQDDEIVMFGGTIVSDDPDEQNDTWTTDRVAWGFQSTTPLPPIRYGHSMTYDPTRDVVVVFGGFSNSGGVLCDTWEFDDGNWFERGPSNPPPDRERMASTYDPDNQEVLIFGGRITTTSLNNDLFAWDGNDWRHVFSGGPEPRHSAKMVHVPGLGVIVFGGQGLSETFDDTWLWDGSTWTELPVSGPPPSQYHDLAYHEATRQVVFFGGTFVNSPCETWVLDVGPVPVLYVDPDAVGNGSGHSWANAATDLQATLAVAVPGQEIRVASGTYKPHPTDRTVSFVIPSGVAVKGGYAGGGTLTPPDERDPDAYRTFLCGDLNNDDNGFGGPFNNRSDNSHHVVDLSGTDADTLLEGFYIINGEDDTGAGSGGGLCVTGLSDATVRDCNFFTNRAYLSAGAVSWSGGNGVLIGCDFVGNHTFGSTAGGGGGMQSGGGAGTRSLYNCRFLGNHTTAAGGGLFASGQTLVVNTVFSGNMADDRGGAVYVVASGSVCTAHNLTVYGNHARECGGIHVFFFSSLNLYNSVLWANTDTFNGDVALQQRCATLASTIAVDQNNAVEGIDPNTPTFVDPDGVDDTLGTPDDDFTPDGLGSRLVDVANPIDLPPDLADLDGDGNTSEGIPLDLHGRTRAVDIGLLGGSLIMDRGAIELCPPNVVTVINPESQFVTEGDAVALFAEVSADNCGFFYEWTKDGAPIPDDPRIVVLGGSITIDPVSPADAGVYLADVGSLCLDLPCGFDTPPPTVLGATLTVYFAADHDGDGDVEITDLLAFLSDWFSGNDIADFNEDGTIDVTDLLGFLSFWFLYN